MRTKYESIIEAVACAMEDHSYNSRWYFDFDEQDTVPLIEESECYPEEGHRLLYIEPMESRESFKLMEDFIETVPNKADQDKLWSALRQRRPFSAFKNMLHYTGQREKWFAFHDEQMRKIVEKWLEHEEIIYENGVFTCNSDYVFEYFKEDN